jgi:protein gp37
LGDLFHRDVPFEWIDRVFAVMAISFQHTFLVLTKRPHRMAEWFTEHLKQKARGYWIGKPGYLFDELLHPGQDHDSCEMRDDPAWFTERLLQLKAKYYPDVPSRAQNLGDSSLVCPWPLPNVWLGTSVENQHAADERIPWLLKCPAAVRFLSMEPLLGPVDLLEHIHTHRCSACNWIGFRTDITDEDENEEAVCPGCGTSDQLGPRMDFLWNPGVEAGEAERRCRQNRHSPIDWIIAGGESGPGARPMHPDWARSVRDQCHAAGVPFFFKQWGSWIPYEQDGQPPFWNGQDGSLVDGHIFPGGLADHIQRGEWYSPELDGVVYRRADRRKNNRLLDGREWNDTPAVKS